MRAANAQPPDAANVANGGAGNAEQPIALMTAAELYRQIGGITHLTLKMEKATKAEIAAEVGKQTGLDVGTMGGPVAAENDAERYSVEATGQPFWEAIHQWNRSEKPLDIVNDYRTNNRWMLAEWAGQQPTGASAGPFYISPRYVTINRTRSLQLDNKAAKPNVNNQLELQGSLKIDPKLGPIVAAVLSEVESAVDDKGRAIAADANSYSQSRRDDLSISLQAPAMDATRLKSLKGRLRVAVVTKQEHWEIDLAAAPKAEKIFKTDKTEVTYRFGGMTAMPDGGWSFKMHIERKNIGPRQVFKGKGRWSQNALDNLQDAQRPFHVVGADNVPLSVDSGGSSGGTNEHGSTLDMTFSIRAPRPDANGLLPENPFVPAKIIVDVPLEYREVQIPFEFKDLPLP